MNATGPWIDGVRALEDPAAAPLGRLSKGVHLLLDLEPTLVGGADDSARPRPRHVRVSVAGDAAARDDRHALRGRPVGGCRRARGRRACARRGVGRSRARDRSIRLGSARASPGLRVLPGLSGETLTRAARDPVRRRAGRHADGRRRQADHLPPDRALRARAAAARARLAAVRPAAACRCPVPAGSRTRAAGSPIASPSSTRQPARTSCTCTAASRRRSLEPASHEPSLLEPIHPGAPDVHAQIAYAGEQEWAVGVEDVVWRRTTLGHRGLADAAAASVAERLGRTEGSGLVLKPTRQSSSAISAAARAAPSVSTGR